MKKVVFFVVFLALATSAFAQNISNRFLFIEGSAVREDQREFFQRNFSLEASTFGYTVTQRKRDAAYTFKFDVVPNTIMVQGVARPAPPEDNQFVLKISLINNKNNEEVLNFDFFFTELIEMYEYIQFIFQRATVYIPSASKEDMIDRSWQNKWLYLRTSFSYPISFYSLQPTGLIGGQAVYIDGEDGPESMIPLSHAIVPQPGVVLGLELQFLNFMSFEANIQINMGDPTTYAHFNLLAGAELKFPLKTKYLIFEPYAAFLYPINVSPVFSDFPPFLLGGGLQICARGGSYGAFFVDINTMFSFSEAARYNNYGPLSPFPEVIHYKYFILGLGIGYKYGNFDRK